MTGDTRPSEDRLPDDSGPLRDAWQAGFRTGYAKAEDAALAASRPAPDTRTEAGCDWVDVRMLGFYCLVHRFGAMSEDGRDAHQRAALSETPSPSPSTPGLSLDTETVHLREEEAGR